MPVWRICKYGKFAHVANLLMWQIYQCGKFIYKDDLLGLLQYFYVALSGPQSAFSCRVFAIVLYALLPAF